MRRRIYSHFSHSHFGEIHKKENIFSFLIVTDIYYTIMAKNNNNGPHECDDIDDINVSQRSYRENHDVIENIIIVKICSQF